MLNSWLFWLATCLLAHSKLTVLAATNNIHQNVNEGNSSSLLNAKLNLCKTKVL